MLRPIFRVLTIVMALMLFVTSASAQFIAPEDPDAVDPNLNISYPLPVLAVAGEVEIVGTINIPNVANYFIEYRELVLEELAPDATPTERPWFPATLPSTVTPINDGVLGVWDTENTDDGLYEIRLTVNVRGEGARFFRVSPLRVANELGIPVMPSLPDRDPLRPTPTQLGGVSRPPVVAATPTATAFSTTPRVVALLDANVRRGDSTVYPRVGALLSAESADILGVSSTGSGWYYIALNDGTRGFISPTTVRVEGNVANLQRIDPPPVPATPTPVATATPIANSNLRITGYQIQPASPTCNVAYEVRINVYNDGPGNSGGPFTVRVVDRNVRTNDVTASVEGTIPDIAPNSNYLLILPLTSSTYYGEEHRVTATVDSNNIIAELNESDNQIQATYTLQQGGCG